MRRVHAPSILAFVVSLAALVPSAAPAAAAGPGAPTKITPQLAEALASAPDGAADMLVVLADQANLSGARRLQGKLAKTRYVYERLTRTAARSQGPVIAALDGLGAPHRAFWIANVIWTRGGVALAAALSARPDVARLDANPKLVLPPTPEDHDSVAPLAPESIEWNLSWVDAPAVWALGDTGQGVVVAGEDTGYQWNHPALESHYRGWNGAAADHNYNWHDAIHSGGGSCGHDTTAPCDDYGHGTHTMGTMVGDDGGANQIGMAPGAKWIGCRNMDQGDGTPARYTECMQWMIAPTDLSDQNPDPAMAPDVINNSWGCPASEGCTTPDILLTEVEAVRAAGIVFVASAGNSGSGCSSVSDPPAIYDASFTVAATASHSDTPASYSSRGPVTVDSSNRMKPDISAPGSSVRSSVPTNGYGSMSGTSMAGPHVAGLVALVISANPALRGDVDTIESIIEQSAFHPDTSSQNCGGIPANVFPNNTFGYGRIDALAAVDLALVTDSPLPFDDGFESGDTSRWSATAP
jgi:serine protease AprX